MPTLLPYKSVHSRPFPDGFEPETKIDKETIIYVVQTLNFKTIGNGIGAARDILIC